MKTPLVLSKEHPAHDISSLASNMASTRTLSTGAKYRRQSEEPITYEQSAKVRIAYFFLFTRRMRLTQTLTSATQSTKQIPRCTRSSHPIPPQIPAQSKSGVQGL